MSASDRRRLAARACAGCASRPGTWAKLCAETQEQLEEAGASFQCHLPTAREVNRWRDQPAGVEPYGYRRPRCAGAVARWGSDADVARALREPEKRVEAWCAVGEHDPCTHFHETPQAALECARALPGGGAVAKALSGRDWIRPSDAVVTDLAAEGATWPTYWQVLGGTWRCGHAHWSLASAAECFLDSPGFISGQVEVWRVEVWPTRTGDEGVLVPDDEVFAALGGAA